MILALCSLSLAEGLPAVEVTWKKELGLLEVDPPPGQHIAPDAPASGWIEVDARRVELESLGSAVEPGIALALPGKDARVISGQLALSLCEDEGTACTPVELAFLGTVDGRKGSEYLGVHPPVPPVEVVVEDAALGPDEAFEQAAAENKLVLLDFGAVWCPPCNQLAVEVLHDDANAPELSGFVLAELDVDLSESWTWKDRYKVGSYPTVVVARADGTEIDRHVGYTSETEFLAWLASTRSERPVDELLVDTSLSAQERAIVALRLARDGRDEEAKAVIADAEDTIDLRIARLRVDPSEEDLVWLATHGRDRLYEWVWWADVELSEEGVVVLTDAVREALVDAEGAHAAELIDLLADHAPEEAQPDLYAAAASALSSSLSGDAALDRPYYTYLAELYRRSGQAERGIELLRDAASAYPHEFTYFYAGAGILLREERFEEALAWSAAAQALAYGDQSLRAAKRAADILVGLERTDEAIAVIDRALRDAEDPGDLEVRTNRYITALEELRAEIAPQ